MFFLLRTWSIWHFRMKTNFPCVYQECVLIYGFIHRKITRQLLFAFSNLTANTAKDDRWTKPQQICSCFSRKFHSSPVAAYVNVAEIIDKTGYVYRQKYWNLDENSCCIMLAKLNSFEHELELKRLNTFNKVDPRNYARESRFHCSDVLMGAIVSQITRLSIVC